jgi:AraC-like DNA-binding protein
MARPNGSLQAISPAVTVVARRIVDLIEKRYAERLTVHSIAAAVRGEPARVDRFFHLATGRTVHEYLTEVRLDHAAHLIRSDIKIEAVALDVGYQSKKNFYRQFARRFGVTPEVYRRSAPHPLPKQPDGNGVKTYAATFDGTPCLIDVEVQKNVKGPDSYCATPFVIVAHGMQPFATTSDHIEMGGTSEAAALKQATMFLERRFGKRSTALKRDDDLTRARPILTPRRP